MKKWFTDPDAGWIMIEAGLTGLIDLEMMDESMIGPLEEELGYSEDDVMDLESSIRSWLRGEEKNRIPQSIGMWTQFDKIIQAAVIDRDKAVKLPLKI